MRLSTPFRRIAGYAGLSLLLALAGCKNGDLPPIAKVKGTVTYKGKPVPNMMVNFMPTAGRPSWVRPTRPAVMKRTTTRIPWA